MAEYIDRETLLAHIKDLPTWWADAGGVYGSSMKYPEGLFDCEDVVSSVENALVVDAAPVIHGRWIDSPQGLNSCKCTACNSTYPGKSRFCPKCGAKMDGKS